MKYWIGPKTDYTMDRQRASSGSLESIDQLFAVLSRLRLSLFNTDIAERFNISEGTLSKYCNTWICSMTHELKLLNPFPSREIVYCLPHAGIGIVAQFRKSKLLTNHI